MLALVSQQVDSVLSMSGACYLAMHSSCTLIFVAIHMWSLGLHVYSVSSYRRISIDPTFLLHLRYFGPAGTCPCRSGSVIFSSCLWRPFAERCGGAIYLL